MEKKSALCVAETTVPLCGRKIKVDVPVTYIQKSILGTAKHYISKLFEESIGNYFQDIEVEWDFLHNTPKVPSRKDKLINISTQKSVLLFDK